MIWLLSTITLLCTFVRVVGFPRATHPPWRRGMLLVALDWDETITASDTLALIAPPASSSQSHATFAALSDSYMSMLSAHNESYAHPRTTLAEECEYLSSVETLECTSLDHVEKSGLFKGERREALLARAKQVGFRPGWSAASQWLASKAGVGTLRCDVISIGWSARFIREALRASDPDGVMPTLVLSNEVELGEDDAGTGRITGSADLDAACPVLGRDGEQRRSGMRTAMDKLHAFTSLVSTNDGTRLPSVYVGDSSTDVPCLLHADVGIIIGHAQSSPVRTLSRVALADRVSMGYEEWNARRRGRKKVQRTYWLPGRSLNELADGSDVVVVPDWIQALQVLQEVAVEHESIAAKQ